MNFKTVIAVVLSMALLAGCAEQGGTMTKQQAGTGVGAAAGAILGSKVGKGSGRVASAIVGGLVGAAVGNSIGSSLDAMDRQYYLRAQQNALENFKTGQTARWTNPDSGNSGSFTPKKTYETEGRYCREYSQSVKVGGKLQQAYGTACRQPDGSWEIVSN